METFGRQPPQVRYVSMDFTKEPTHPIATWVLLGA